MKRRYIYFTVYLLFIVSVIFTSAILARYVYTGSTEIDFNVGSTLYFDYERYQLFRNDQLIVGVESEYEENGQTYQRIETMNVVPGDSLIYHFYVTNFNDITSEYNLVDGLFFPNAKTTLSLPMKGKIYDIDCTIQYRQVPYGPDDTSTPVNDVWKNLVTDGYIDLPISNTQKVKYEFKVSVLIDDQVEDTTSDDYFDATLIIKLFINAASDD